MIRLLEYTIEDSDFTITPQMSHDRIWELLFVFVNNIHGRKSVFHICDHDRYSIDPIFITIKNNDETVLKLEITYYKNEKISRYTLSTKKAAEIIEQCLPLYERNKPYDLNHVASMPDIE